ncbi:MAG: HlyD family secretion protein [Propionivibrio sp.]|uniref:HlyD family secretion protein n=1 Tax=Propionivibrio sp. TaxID=2212460 RepID=UPI001A5DA403|nr:efflux RND transporter periplasmic adaptor subunit [Propionivibrio sp.]MBL8416554.1 HlyD family secretion protein [Propionivibrio sp.]
MIAGLVMVFGYALIVWAVFFKFKWLKFSIPWGVVSAFVGVHLLIIFMIGLRFMTPLATDARIIQHTIQLTPRLPEPTLLMAVLVEPNVPVKKGQPLFQFDRRMFEYKVRQLDAELAKAKQNVLVMKTDIEVATQKVSKNKAHLEFARYQQTLSANLAKQGAGPEEDAQKWAAQVAADSAAIKEAQAEEQRAILNYTSEINGVNTSVARTQAELDQARFYLENTLMVAPEDGYIINLQARPGMVAGDVRFGAIASFVCDADRYLLANFFQENLKYVKPGQEVEAAIDLYPGQIFTGKVLAIWQGSGAGQMLPSGTLPNFQAVPTDRPQGQFAVAIKLDDPDQSKFPIGTQGRATIYANPQSLFVILRKISIRAYTWFNWIYPFSG